jgi:hypothetical protein
MVVGLGSGLDVRRTYQVAPCECYVACPVPSKQNIGLQYGDGQAALFYAPQSYMSL